MEHTDDAVVATHAGPATAEAGAAGNAIPAVPDDASTTTAIAEDPVAPSRPPPSPPPGDDGRPPLPPVLSNQPQVIAEEPRRPATPPPRPKGVTEAGAAGESGAMVLTTMRTHRTVYPIGEPDGAGCLDPDSSVSNPTSPDSPLARTAVVATPAGDGAAFRPEPVRIMSIVKGSAGFGFILKGAMALLVVDPSCSSLPPSLPPLAGSGVP